MAYTIRVKSSAEKELSDLPLDIQDRVLKRLMSLKENPRPIGVKRLQERNGYRIRVGNYRILYAIDDSIKTVEILSVSPRKDAYR